MKASTTNKQAKQLQNFIKNRNQYQKKRTTKIVKKVLGKTAVTAKATWKMWGGGKAVKF